MVGQQGKINSMFISTLLISAMMIVNAPAWESVIVSETPFGEMLASSQQTVRFRSTQKLRARDGREIYFYSSVSVKDTTVIVFCFLPRTRLLMMRYVCWTKEVIRCIKEL